MDSQGKTIITRDLHEIVGKKSNRPVFTFLDLTALNTGILGGRVTSTKAIASLSVDVVKRFFQGSAIDSIKIDKPYSENIYEWGELKKWDIDITKLPPNSIIQNRKYTFFELFKWEIVGGILLFLVESFLVIILFINCKERKKAEKLYHNMLQRLLTAQEEERTRIAMDLHDGLGQNMLRMRAKITSLFFVYI